MKFKRDYLIGGTNGKNNPSDYVVGYLADNGMYIDIVELINSTFRWYRVGNKSFELLKHAKAYCESFGN